MTDPLSCPMFDDRMAALESEFESVEAELADPETLADPDRLRDLSRRHKELGEIVRVWHELGRSRADVIVAREMLTEASGDERELMRQEVEQAEGSVSELEERIQSLLLPKDPNIGRNVIMEIRGAVGGDEANLFARVLFDMYQRFAALEKWKVEVLSEDSSDRDGINEAVFLIKGKEAYLRLEHEAGTAPRAARAGDRGQGPGAHVDGDGHRAARGGRGGDRHRPR